MSEERIERIEKTISELELQLNKLDLVIDIGGKRFQSQFEKLDNDIKHLWIGIILLASGIISIGLGLIFSRLY